MSHHARPSILPSGKDGFCRPGCFSIVASCRRLSDWRIVLPLRASPRPLGDTRSTQSSFRQASLDSPLHVDKIFNPAPLRRMTVAQDTGQNYEQAPILTSYSGDSNLWGNGVHEMTQYVLSCSEGWFSASHSPSKTVSGTTRKLKPTRYGHSNVIVKIGTCWNPHLTISIPTSNVQRPTPIKPQCSNRSTKPDVAPLFSITLELSSC